jgi:hypothetical protein
MNTEELTKKIVNTIFPSRVTDMAQGILSEDKKKALIEAVGPYELVEDRSTNGNHIYGWRFHNHNITLYMSRWYDAYDTCPWDSVSNWLYPELPK